VSEAPHSPLVGSPMFALAIFQIWFSSNWLSTGVSTKNFASAIPVCGDVRDNICQSCASFGTEPGADNSECSALEPPRQPRERESLRLARRQAVALVKRGFFARLRLTLLQHSPDIRHQNYRRNAQRTAVAVARAEALKSGASIPLPFKPCSCFAHSGRMSTAAWVRDNWIGTRSLEGAG